MCGSFLFKPPQHIWSRQQVSPQTQVNNGADDRHTPKTQESTNKITSITMGYFEMKQQK